MENGFVGECPHCRRHTPGVVSPDGFFIRCRECRQTYMIPREVRERFHLTGMAREDEDTRRPTRRKRRARDIVPELRERTATLVGLSRVLAGLTLVAAVILVFVGIGTGNLGGFFFGCVGAALYAFFAALIYFAGQWIETAGEALALPLEEMTEPPEPAEAPPAPEP